MLSFVLSVTGCVDALSGGTNSQSIEQLCTTWFETIQTTPDGATREQLEAEVLALMQFDANC